MSGRAITHYAIMHTLKDLGLVDVNTVIAWYYNELVLGDPICAIHGMPVAFAASASWNAYSVRDRNGLILYLETNPRGSKIAGYKTRTGVFALLYAPQLHQGRGIIGVCIQWTRGSASGSSSLTIPIPVDLVRS
jgi:hypothetical protein